MHTLYSIYRSCRGWLTMLVVGFAIAALPGLAAAQPQGLTLGQGLPLGVFGSLAPWPGMPVNATPIIIAEDTLTTDLTYLLLATRLVGEGYIVQGFPLPLLGGADIHYDAMALGHVVDLLLSTTGAKQVHIIGHGQGAIVARSYIHDHPNKVETLVSLAAPHLGTSIASAPAWQYFVPTLFGCYRGNPFALLQPPSCRQLTAGSDLLTEINNRPSNDTVHYTNVKTLNDMWIDPADNAFMTCSTKKDSKSQALCTNLTFQDVCPNHPIDHLALPLDDKVATLALKALQHVKIDKAALSCP